MHCVYVVERILFTKLKECKHEFQKVFDIYLQSLQKLQDT